MIGEVKSAIKQGDSATVLASLAGGMNILKHYNCRFYNITHCGTMRINFYISKDNKFCKKITLPLSAIEVQNFVSKHFNLILCYQTCL